MKLTTKKYITKKTHRHSLKYLLKKSRRYKNIRCKNINFANNYRCKQRDF